MERQAGHRFGDARGVSSLAALAAAFVLLPAAAAGQPLPPDPAAAGCRPGPERCNGRDDDCDGQTDELWRVGGPCQVGTGACRQPGVLVCSPDGRRTICAGEPAPPGPELCGNGVDDDCDGKVDEGFDVGAACSEGVGACRRRGRKVCAADGRGTVCDAVPGPPGEELCGNGVDDDCDGERDEGFTMGDGCTVGVGACQRRGRQVCSADRRSTTCDVRPGKPDEELCGNGVDDDCDGAVDEGFDIGAACSSGVGACRRDGQKVCAADGRGTRCDARPGAPGLELCGNGVDDDCDGKVDEGFDVGAACSEGVGACRRRGRKVCAADGRGTVCDAVPGSPGEELCGNGVDDDCDGERDEGFTVGDGCTVGVGACQRRGRQVCSADRRSTTCDVRPGKPGEELCGNGVDDDCDGAIDEGFDVGERCAVGVGACRQEGHTVCSADRRGVICDARPLPPSSERCGNGVDDDCDGAVDEGFDVGKSCFSAGQGACRQAGQLVCAADGRTTICDAVPGQPIPELCGNGVDDDCDGAVDEGFDVGKPCAVGIGACASQGRRVCSPDGTKTVCDAVAGQPVQELCGNGVDDDCDGAIDEGFDVGKTCAVGQGACRRQGVFRCSPDATGAVCDAVPGEPTAELCGDGVDNDCDGQTDEGWSDRDGDGLICDNCPDVANITQEDRDGDGVGDACDEDTPMLRIPGQGPTLLGAEPGRGFPGQEPQRRVQLPDFEIDKHEVTNREYARCVQAGVCLPPASHASYSRPAYFGNPEFDDHPVVQVSWEQARMYCRWLNKRLPTADEWEKAASAGSGRPFPWGGVATDLYPFAEPEPECTRGNFNSAKGCSAGDTERAGAFPAGSSPYGVRDMAGNVWEWTVDPASPRSKDEAAGGAPASAEESSAESGALRVIRGGSFASRAVHIRVSASDAQEAGRPSSMIGFRCVR